MWDPVLPRKAYANTTMHAPDAANTYQILPEGKKKDQKGEGHVFEHRMEVDMERHGGAQIDGL